jgi:phenylacetate-CoA ligase
MIDRLALRLVLGFLALLRGFVQTEPRFFAALAAPGLQPLLAWIGRVKAYEVYLKARDECPAYKQFLAAESAPEITRPGDLAHLPATTKENYVKTYSIEDRCYGGRIPSRGVVIDESSGSSGVPNNWVRGPEERNSVKAIIQLSYAQRFTGGDLLILNCFALGPWATGMNVSMSLVDVGIMKSIGPDKAKLENALKLFGPRYRYLVTGYPPFIKNFVDTAQIDLAAYDCTSSSAAKGCRRACAAISASGSSRSTRPTARPISRSTSARRPISASRCGRRAGATARCQRRSSAAMTRR